MNKNINFYNLKPKYYFGENAIEELKNELKVKQFKKTMIVYGKGSIKKNNIYNTLINTLFDANVGYIEFEGIEPNPRDLTIQKAIDLGIKNKVDSIIAVGGGSVIDAAKVIATLITNMNHYSSVWDYVVHPKEIRQLPIPIIAIPTLSGTASENNGGSVVTNQLKNLKKGVIQQHAIPYLVIADPTYTYTVNQWQTASGIFDCFSHLLEQYFSQNTFEWTKQMIFANLKVLLKYSSIVLQEPQNYEARANIMWTCAMSLNSTTSWLSDSDWSVHVIEHAFSGLWDITHGAGLALITPVYLQVRSNKEKWFYDKVVELGESVFNVKDYDSTINKIKEFISQLNLPSKWNEFDEIKEFSESNEYFLLNHSTQFGDESMKDIYKEVISRIKSNV